jgi:hypothetical protein
MSAQKSMVGLILFARNEATYNAAGLILTGSTDTIDTAEQPLFQQQYAVEGTRGPAMYGRGQLPRVAPNVRSLNGSVKVHAKGPGATMTAVVRPPSVHAYLQSSGMSGSLEGATWVYKPTPLGTTPSSLAMDIYDMGERMQLRGGYSTFMLDMEGALPVFTFDVQGVQSGSITDVPTPPARVFPASSVIPPRLETIGLLIGSYAPKVRKAQYSHGLSISQRIDLNASGSNAGYAIGRQDNSFTVTIEADALATFDPYADRDTATPKAITATIGNVANNKFTLALGACALTDVQKVALEDNVAGLELTYKPSTNADGSNGDDIRFTWS